MDNQATRRTALITGASAGIGAAFADVYARTGHNVILIARRVEKLNEIAAALEQRYRINAFVLPADLADPAAPAEILAGIAAQNLTADAIVNNAGYGINGRFDEIDWKRHADFLQVMATACLELSHRAIPGMVARGYGRVINVASLAGFMPGIAGGTLYAAVKSLLIKASQAMNAELRGTGVHVTAVCPGLTRSEFHETLGLADNYNRIPGVFWQTAEAVALEGFDAVMRGQAVVVTGAVNKAAAALLRVLPDGLIAGGYRQARTGGAAAATPPQNTLKDEPGPSAA